MSIHMLLSAIVAVWIYYDAKKKCGYSQNAALLWALGAVLAVYVVALVYLLFGRKPRNIARQSDAAAQVTEAGGEEATDVSEKVNCPMCGGSVPASFSRCPRCGYTLKLCCTNCGRELEREWKTCPYCGTAAPEK